MPLRGSGSHRTWRRGSHVGRSSSRRRIQLPEARPQLPAAGGASPPNARGGLRRHRRRRAREDRGRDPRPASTDAIRFAPGTARAFEGGPEGMELLAIGFGESGDSEMLEDFWGVD